MGKAKSFRSLVVRYEKGFLVGLVIVLLVIFVVVSDIQDLVSGHARPRVDPKERAGTFSVLPGEIRTVSWADYSDVYAQLMMAMRFLYGGVPEKGKDTAVWTQLILLEAARREGITVSDDELSDVLGMRLPPELRSDPRVYRERIQQTFGCDVSTFEASIRDLLRAERVRQIYAEAYLIAPPLSRKDLFERYANQNVEYARVSWCARDAKDLAKDAKTAFEAEAEPDKVLQPFFDTDAAVKSEAFQFQHPRRHKIEVLYVMHKRLFGEGNWKRLESLFARTYADKPVAKLEGTAKEIADYLEDESHRKRLLAYHGTTWEKLVPEPTTALPEIDPNDPESAKRREEAESKAKSEVETARRGAARELLLGDIDREVRVRNLMQFLRDQAGADEKRSLKALFEKFKANDDPQDPVCSAEAGKGLLVYLEYPQGLSVDEMQKIVDDGIEFGFNFSSRITGTGDKDLPKVGLKADLLGKEGTDGRMIWRVLDVEKERRKTFGELTTGEKETLRDSFYLPEQARVRARSDLEELRKQFVDGGRKAAEFRAVAGTNGRRLFESQWITASSDYLADPSPKTYWPAELAMLRDRHALHDQLQSVLARDRREKKLGPDSFLEVQVESRKDREDPGTAYLVLLHERREPSAETVPSETLETFLTYASRLRRGEDEDWWSKDFTALRTRFRMEFFGDMQDRIERDVKEKQEAQDSGRP